ncbi:MAG TPA: cytochrome c [Fluviicoccus sp.]|nr:cytochrome c [Fluviicoccus sp.]
MTLSRLWPATLCAAALLAATPAVAAVDGPALYKEHCAKCHAETGHADNWRGYLYFARNFTSPDWQRKMSDADILEEINDGPRIMPSYRDALNAEQKAALVRVIRGFGGK